MFELITGCPDYNTPMICNLKPCIPFDNLLDVFLFTLRQVWGSRDCTAEVRTLAWSQRGRSSSPVIDVIQSIVCCWFFSMSGFALGTLFSPLLKNQHVQIPIWSGKCLQLVVRGPMVYHRLELYVSSFTSRNNEFGLVLCLELIYLVNACESGE